MNSFITMWLNVMLVVNFLSCDGVLTEERSYAKKKCEPITIPLCKDIGYNLTSLPNRFNHLKQEEAGMEVHQFWPLVEVGCSKFLKFFLCSMYAPICLQDYHESLPPCREICEHAREGCAPLMKRYGFEWPENLDCTKLPKKQLDSEQLCMGPESMGGGGGSPTKTEQPTKGLLPDGVLKPPPTPKYTSDDRLGPPIITPPSLEHPWGTDNCKCRCTQPFVSLLLNEGKKHLTVGNISSCSYPCYSPFIANNDQGQNQRFLTTWIGVLAIGCCLTTFVTVLTFLIDKDRFGYPERPVFILAFCYLMVSVGYIIRLGAGHQDVACHGNIVRTSLTGSGSSTKCTMTFLFLYFFGMASSCWWVILSLTWFLAAGLKWSNEAISNYSQYFHIAAWGVPCVKTVLILALNGVDGDPLTGVCFVGNTDLTFLRTFVLGPLCVYLVLGVCFLASGFVSLIRIHNVVKAQQGQSKIQKLTRLMAKIGIFSVLYTIPATGVLASLFYEQHFRDLWELSLTCPCQPPIYSNQSMYFLAATKSGASLLVGITTLFWIWSPKTLLSWRNFCSRAFCCQTVHHYGQQPTYHPAEAIIIKSHTDISSQAAYSSTRHGYPMNHV